MLTRRIGFLPLLFSTCVAVQAETVPDRIQPYPLPARAERALVALAGEADVLVLGEMHGSQEVPAVAAALLGPLTKLGYGALALEVPAEEQGPLTDWATGKTRDDSQFLCPAGRRWSRQRSDSGVDPRRLVPATALEADLLRRIESRDRQRQRQASQDGSPRHVAAVRRRVRCHLRRARHGHGDEPGEATPTAGPPGQGFGHLRQLSRANFQPLRRRERKLDISARRPVEQILALLRGRAGKGPSELVGQIGKRRTPQWRIFRQHVDRRWSPWIERGANGPFDAAFPAGRSPAAGGRPLELRTESAARHPGHVSGRANPWAASAAASPASASTASADMPAPSQSPPSAPPPNTSPPPPNVLPPSACATALTPSALRQSRATAQRACPAR